MQPSTEKSLLSQGEKLCYDEIGAGTSVVFLHAGIADRRMWDPQFDALKESFRLVRPDLPGYGCSPIPNRQFSYVTTILDLLDALKLRTVWLAGNSFGGQVALDFCLTHPDRVSGLILLAPVASGFKPSDRLVRFNLDEDTLLEAGDLEGATDLNVRMWVDGPDRPAAQVDPAVRAKVREMQLEAFMVPEPEGASSIKIAPPAIGRLDEIRVPTLILAGEHDLVEIRDHGAFLAEAILSSRHVVLRGTGHVLSMEAPEEFSRTLRSFIQSSPLPWSLEEWRDRAESWVKSSLEEAGRQPEGAADFFHIRPWSAVARIKTDQGDCFLKAPAPFLAYEASLASALAVECPDRMPDLIAVNPGQGWMLMADGGKRLRLSLRSADDAPLLGKALEGYAAMQVGLVGRVPLLLGLGVPDRRPERLPDLFLTLLGELEVFRGTEEVDLTLERLDAFPSPLPSLERLIRMLAEYSIPETIEHGDLHDGNIFFNEDGFVFFDWGDASITHPFVSLRTTFLSLETTLGLAEGAEELDELKVAYLKSWTDYAPLEGLKEALSLALIIAPLNRALTWHNILSRVDEDQRSPYRHAVPSLLMEFYEKIAAWHA